MAMGLVDTMMVGRVSSVDLAAVALGNLFFFGIAIFGLGVLLVLDPIVSQALGSGDHEAAARGVQRGIVLAVGVAAVGSLLLLSAETVFRIARQPPEVIPVAVAYVLASTPGAAPFFIFVVFRQSLQAAGRVGPILATVLSANLVNVGLNWVFIWGNLGMPALGALGSAIATSLSRWFLAVSLLVSAWSVLRPLLVPVRWEAARPGPLLRMLRMGLPIGAQFQLEWGAFAVTGLLMGTLGTTTMGAHQIALNLAAFTFMIPMGIGAAAAVTVGFAVGQGDADRARRSAASALLIGLAFMAGTATLFLGFPDLLSRAFTDDAGVLAIAVLLLPIAGVFQVFDGLQAVAGGVLRGVGDTHAPMWANILGFWLFGLPLSLFLAFRLGMGPEGLWWGLAGGLAAVATLLMVRVVVRMRRELRRLAID